jgi:GT2 family glycosyltransferase
MPERSRTAPRAWPTVLRLALAARPRLALRGLGSLLRGCKVRGWNQLSRAAADHPFYYAAWIGATEPKTLPMPCDTPPALIGAVLIGENPIIGGDATRASLVAAFGRDVPIFTDLPPTADRPAWLLPIRAGDIVAPALGAVLAERLPIGDTRLVYWDEDRLVAGTRATPWIKPDWDPLLFGTYDGLIGACVLRADVVPEGDVDDWPALARNVAKTLAPLHLPLILTHRAAARTASPRPAPPAPPVSISVIVPTRDRANLLETCLDGLARTRFPGTREIVVVDNDSCEAATRALFDRVEADGTARVLHQPGPFDFAAMINAGVAAAEGDLVCLLNNDIEIIDPDWLMRMVPLALNDRTGAVGARLLYPDGTIQHAGVALGIGGAAGHVEKGVRPEPGVFTPWHGETRTVSAVTAACLLVRRDRFDEVGGMDRVFSIDFNDVDLCLRLAERGWRTVYCAEATLVHHESISRGTKRVGPDLARFERELEALRTRWATRTVRDPYHSPLFRRESERCLLAF